jgi:Restriction endonuclease
MPTIQMMELPLPTSWQEFETIVRDAQAQRWKSTALQKNGRPGQKQNGVDIYGPDEIGRLVGIQCKRYKEPLTLKSVTDEIVKAEGFDKRLLALYIATSAEHDGL